MTFGCHLSILIKAGSATCNRAHHRINDHVAWPCVEGNPGNLVCIAAHHCHIADATDILHRCGLPAGSKQDFIQVRHQWGTLAAYRDIRGTEISHRQNACTVGYHRRLADLQRRLAGNMPDRLTVGPYNFHLLRRNPCFPQKLQYGACKQLAQAEVHRTDFTHGSSARFAQAQNRGPLLRRIGNGDKLLQRESQGRIKVQPDQGGIDTVHRGSRHQTNCQAFHEISPFA